MNNSLNTVYFNPLSQLFLQSTAVEQYNMILMYFDAEARDPPYYPPEIEGITDKRMVYRGAVDKLIHMHIQVRLNEIHLLIC